jgi:hypothetical protein
MAAKSFITLAQEYAFCENVKMLVIQQATKLKTQVRFGFFSF